MALARETGARPAESTRVIEHPGSDYMVDVIKSLNIEYLAANPGSTYESLHESLINYGDNKMPEFLTCCHEESAVAMAHGYAKIEGKPMMALIHGDIGLQHAAMAIYNAYCDRVPIYMVVGNHSDGARRNPGVQSMHSAQDLGALVRDYTKWDDEPLSLGHFAESAVRAYNIAMTPPQGPVLIVCNAEIQGDPMPGATPRIPKLTLTTPPAGDRAAVQEAAKLLIAADRPQIIAQRMARTPEGMTLLVELAELLQTPVNSQERINFPTRHPLAGTGWQGYQPDVTLNLEVGDILPQARIDRARGAKTIQITSVSIAHKSNIQDFGHYADIDLDIGADAQATLPALIEEIKKELTRRSQARAARAWREVGRGAQEGLGRSDLAGAVRLGFQPHQSGAALRRAMAADQERRLVAGFTARLHRQLAEALVEIRQALSIYRRTGRGWHGLWRAGLGGRRSGQSQTWPPLGQHPDRRRHELCSRRVRGPPRIIASRC